MNKSKIRSSIFIYILTAVLVVLAAICLRFLFYRYLYDEKYINTDISENRSVIVDPGHGGFDGGAVSVTGTAEKFLNLELSLTLRDMFSFLGYDVVMTRDNDTELSGTAGSRKMKDLKGRLEIAENNPDSVFISVHMNKFPESRYNGLQVYYSVNSDRSKPLAESIKLSVKNQLQNSNNRETKPATSSIFILHKIKLPAVLVECGFLSNPKEAADLEIPLYREKLAFAILCGFLDSSEVLYSAPK